MFPLCFPLLTAFRFLFWFWLSVHGLEAMFPAFGKDSRAVLSL